MAAAAAARRGAHGAGRKNDSTNGRDDNTKVRANDNGNAGNGGNGVISSTGRGASGGVNTFASIVAGTSHDYTATGAPTTARYVCHPVRNKESPWTVDQTTRSHVADMWVPIFVIDESRRPPTNVACAGIRSSVVLPCPPPAMMTSVPCFGGGPVVTAVSVREGVAVVRWEARAQEALAEHLDALCDAFERQLKAQACLAFALSRRTTDILAEEGELPSGPQVPVFFCTSAAHPGCCFAARRAHLVRAHEKEVHSSPDAAPIAVAAPTATPYEQELLTRIARLELSSKSATQKVEQLEEANRRLLFAARASADEASDLIRRSEEAAATTVRQGRQAATDGALKTFALEQRLSTVQMEHWTAMAGYEARQEELLQQLAAQDKSNDQSERAIDTARRRAEAAETELRRMSAHLAQTQAAVREETEHSRRTHDELQRALATGKQHLQRLVEERALLRGEGADKATMSAQISELEQRLANSAKELAECAKPNLTVLAEIARRDNEIANRDKQVTDLRLRLDRASADAHEANTRAAKADRDARNAREETRATRVEADNRLMIASKERTAAELSLVEARAAAHKESEARAHAIARAAAAEDREKELCARINRGEAALGRLEARQAQATQSEAQAQHLLTEVTASRAQLVELKASRADAEQRAATAAQERLTADNNLSAATATVRASEEEVQRLKLELDHASRTGARDSRLRTLRPKSRLAVDEDGGLDDDDDDYDDDDDRPLRRPAPAGSKKPATDAAGETPRAEMADKLSPKN